MLEDVGARLDRAELAAHEDLLEEVAEGAVTEVRAEVAAGVREQRHARAALLQVEQHVERVVVDAQPAAEVGQPEPVDRRVAPLLAQLALDAAPVLLDAQRALVERIAVPPVRRPEHLGIAAGQLRPARRGRPRSGSTEMTSP